MKLKPRQVTLAAIAFVGVALAMWCFLAHGRVERAVARYKDQLRASGEKLALEELIPPPLPPDRNGVAIFYRAGSRRFTATSLFETNTPSSMRMVAPGKAMVRWARPDIRDSVTNSWEDAEGVLAKDGESLEILEGLIEQPILDFQLDYRQGFALLLPHLAPLKQAAVRLSAAAACDLHNGDAESAARRVRAILALAKGLGNEPLVISQLVRIAIASLAVDPTWGLLQSPAATEAQLVVLQKDWLDLDFLQTGAQALSMERALGEWAFAKMRASSAEFRRNIGAFNFGGGGGSGSGGWYDQLTAFAADKAKESLWRAAYSYPDQLRALQGYQILLDAIRLARRDHCFMPALRQQEARLSALGFRTDKPDDDSMPFSFTHLDLRTMFSTEVLSSLQRTIRRYMSAEGAKRIAITAIALRRFQLRHGSYPPDLAALTPQFLPAIPPDPADGKPLRYLLRSNGTFLLYSIGEDGKDDGGDPTTVVDANKRPSGYYYWQRGRDWVWPQPATPEEIAAYEQKAGSRR